MKKTSLGLVLLTIFLAVVLLKNASRFPITYQEAGESYNTYSVLQTGRDVNGKSWPLIFRGENTYPSTLAIYTRLPFIKLFGLNKLGVRLPTVIFGTLAVFLFWRWVGFYKKGSISPLVAAWLFLLSPWLIRLRLFDLSGSLALFLLLGGSVIVSKFRSGKYFWIGMGMIVLALPASIYSLIAAVFLAGWAGWSRFGRKGIFLAALPLLLLLFFFRIDNQMKDSLIRESVISALLPNNSLWQVERRRAFDQVERGPFYGEMNDVNRLIHNKWLFALNAGLTEIARPFNLERLSSPWQAKAVLENESTDANDLPKIFFIEIPLIFAGVLLLLRERKELLILGLGGAFSVIFFPQNNHGLLYLLPFLLVAEAAGVSCLQGFLAGRKKMAVLGVGFLIWVFSQLSFWNVFLNQPQVWFAENDFRQGQIWGNLKNTATGYREVEITDRLGEPVDYLLYYLKYPPSDYQKGRRLGGIDDLMRQKIAQVGKFSLGSFKYLESDRQPGQLWVGLAGEFVGRFNSYGEETVLPNGRILAKIKDVKSVDPHIGDEIWLVETSFPKKADIR